MENILLTAEALFRFVCGEFGYDLKREEEAGIINELFWGWLVEFSMMCSDEKDGPSDVLECLAISFATNEKFRADMIATYTARMISLACGK